MPFAIVRVRSMKIGLIADTHNDLPPQVAAHFAGVDRILHAGDVCDPGLITRLQGIAPVTVVAGNNDFHPSWRETEVVDFANYRFLIQHIVAPHHPTPTFSVRLLKIRPQVVVFGHTHRPFSEVVDGVHYLNPGSAGQSRSGIPRSVCLVHITAEGLHPVFFNL
ncbi:MAG: metallophosphoesterase family protein [Verrucomicrobiales bacterium]|nr:metallophosphoesterase family protein [Verrucomicrobiales bacterium]